MDIRKTRFYINLMIYLESSSHAKMTPDTGLHFARKCYGRASFPAKSSRYIG